MPIYYVYMNIESNMFIYAEHDLMPVRNSVKKIFAFSWFLKLLLCRLMIKWWTSFTPAELATSKASDTKKDCFETTRPIGIQYNYRGLLSFIVMIICVL